MAKKATTAKTYYLYLKNGDVRKITIPGHWKMTFGNVIPYQGKDGRHGEARIALRLYDGNKDNLQAVYMDVVSFQNADITTLEKRTTVNRKARQEEGDSGLRDVVVEARVTEWVDPNNEGASAPPARFKQIGHTPGDDEEDF